MATESFGLFYLRNVFRVGTGVGYAVVARLARPATDPPMINTGSSQ